MSRAVLRIQPTRTVPLCDPRSRNGRLPFFPFSIYRSLRITGACQTTTSNSLLPPLAPSAPCFNIFLRWILAEVSNLSSGGVTFSISLLNSLLYHNQIPPLVTEFFLLAEQPDHRAAPWANGSLPLPFPFFFPSRLCLPSPLLSSPLVLSGLRRGCRRYSFVVHHFKCFPTKNLPVH